MSGEAVGDGGEQVSQERHQGGVVREVRVEVAGPVPGAAFLPFEQRRQGNGVEEALIARRHSVTGIALPRSGRAAQGTDVPARRAGQQPQVAREGRREASAQAVQVEDGGPYVGDLRLDDRLARIGDGEDLEVHPQSFECPYLFQDEGLRQARVAAHDDGDRWGCGALE